MDKIKYKLKVTLVLVVVCFIYINSYTQTNKGTDQKDWTPHISAAKRCIYTYLGKSIFPSRDGKYFYFVTCRDNLKSDLRNYEFNIYNTEDVLAALNNKKRNPDFYLKPLKAVTISGNFLNCHFFPSKNETFGWSNDNKSIVIESADDDRGKDPKDTARIYKFNMTDGSLEIIKSIDISKGVLDEINCLSNDASTMVFGCNLTNTIIPEGLGRMIEYPESEIKYESPMELLYLSKVPLIEKIKNYLYHKGKIYELPEHTNSWLSPDGSKLIVSQEKTDFSSSWPNFYMATTKAEWETNNNGTTYGFSRFMLIDANNSDNLYPVIEAPLGENTKVGSNFENLTKVLFTGDNKYAILVNSALPIKEGQSKRDEMSYVVAVNLENGSYESLSPIIEQQDTLSDVGWSREGNELLISYRHGKGNKTIGYTLNGSKWIKDNSLTLEKPKEFELPDGLDIVVRQDVNTPPMIVASNGKNELLLTAPDTALQNVYIAPAKEISWKMPDGRVLTGGLTLPRGYEKMKPLPLIVENFGFHPGQFNPDDNGSYVIQSFAAQGYAILKLDIALDDLKKKYGSYEDHLIEEGPHYVAMVDAAVKGLVDSGLIDPDKIGMIGFSRGGYETLYAVTHPGKTKIAAAVHIDGWTGSIYNYLLGGAEYARQFENKYKGSFWKNKQSWLEHEPIFNVDRIKTPYLLNVHGYGGNERSTNMIFAQFSDLMGAFQINRKPLEILYYPKSLHGLVHPKEIYASTVSTLDWMNFWMKGKETPDPLKAERNKYWRELKVMQEESLKNMGDKDEIKKGAIHQPAPDFSLLDLNGNKVSLKDFKGKIVVIDFWATWCKPCKASFPGMQELVDKYATSNDVKFLFIDTKESVTDKKKIAEDFLKQNDYTFNVLLDEDNKAFENYKVDGIPAKFIIDKEGIIKFKSTGFNGSTDGLVKELSAMIELTRNSK